MNELFDLAFKRAARGAHSASIPLPCTLEETLVQLAALPEGACRFRVQGGRIHYSAPSEHNLYRTIMLNQRPRPPAEWNPMWVGRDPISAMAWIEAEKVTRPAPLPAPVQPVPLLPVGNPRAELRQGIRAALVRAGLQPDNGYRAIVERVCGRQDITELDFQRHVMEVLTGFLVYPRPPPAVAALFGQEEHEAAFQAWLAMASPLQQLLVADLHARFAMEGAGALQHEHVEVGGTHTRLVEDCNKAFAEYPDELRKHQCVVTHNLRVQAENAAAETRRREAEASHAAHRADVLRIETRLVWHFRSLLDEHKYTPKRWEWCGLFGG